MKERIESYKIVEVKQDKLSFKVCNDNLIVAAVAQKNNQYICWQHAKYDKRKNYQCMSDCQCVPEIQNILESYDYNINSVSALGEKSLKKFPGISIDQITNLIWNEIQEISDVINLLL